MSIREAARQAWLAARSDRESEARAVLAGVLAPFDQAKLTTVDVDIRDGYTLFVFHDPADDVHVAVRLRGVSGDGEVLVVAATDVGWTVVSAPVVSLADLHVQLPDPAPEPDPEPEPVTYPAWTTGVAYKIGDRVTYDGAVWEAVQGDGAGNNVWRPGEYGWRQVAV